MPLGDQEHWREIAVLYRDALKIMRPDMPDTKCFPGEPDACGRSFADHAITASALMGATGLHHAEHAGQTAASDWWAAFDAHRFTLHRHNGGRCDCDPDDDA